MNGDDARQTGPRDMDAGRDAALADGLRRLGYDIEPASGGDPPADALRARRDLEDRGILLAVDRSGRFRVEITWVVGEWPSRLEIGGIATLSVDRVTRSVSLTGQVDEPRRLLDVVAGLDQIVPWAGTADRAPAAPDAPPIAADSPPPS